MKCPVCKQTRLAAGKLEQELTTHDCPDCGGRWIASHRYLDWLERHGPNLPEKPAGANDALPVADSAPGKLCPECGAFLVRHRVGHGVDFQIGRCGRCGGFWLDGNEWEILKGRNLHDDLHLVMSQAWQTQVRRERDRQSYRQTVTDILDAKLLQGCNQADLAKLKALKQWLDGHPQADQLYAYLASTRDL